MKNLTRSSGKWRGEVTKRHRWSVTPVSTVQHCIPRSLTPEIPPDVCVSLEGKDDEVRMNPEPTELDSPSAGTGLETPGQQCPPNGETWETGRTIADGHLLIGMDSNQGRDISSTTERVGTRAGTAQHRQIHQTPSSERQAANPGTRHPAKRTSNLTPVGKTRSQRFGAQL